MLAFVPRACAHVLVLILIDMSVFMLVGWVCVMCVIGVLQVVDWLEINVRFGFTMTRLLGRATCSLLLTGRKSVFVWVSP